MTSSADHSRLFIPGPVEVRPEILEAQTEWMIGHRSAAFADLYARMQPQAPTNLPYPKPGLYFYLLGFRDMGISFT